MSEVNSQAKKPGFWKRLGMKFKAMFSEVKKVNWPTFKKTVKTTGIVFLVVIFFTLIILGADSLLSWLLGLVVGAGA